MLSAPLRQRVQEFGFGLFRLAEEEVCREDQSASEIQQFADCSNAMCGVGGERQCYHQSTNIIPRHRVIHSSEDARTGFHCGALSCRLG
jgi:hypothetical protein